MNRRCSRWIGLIAGVVATAGGAQTLEPRAVARQAAPDLFQPPNHPLIVRLNGLRSLTSRIFPAVMNASGALNQSLARHDITNQVSKITFKDPVFGTPIDIGVRVKVWVTSVALQVPVENDDWSAQLLPAPADQLRLDSLLAFNRARLDFNLHVQVTPIDPVSGALPPDIKRLLGLNQSFAIGVQGITADLDLHLQRSGNAATVKEVVRFAVQVTSVTIGGAALLTEIADKVLAWNELAGVTGASNANTAITRLANNLLAENLDMRADLRKGINAALREHTQQEFPSQELPIATGVNLWASPSLAGWATDRGRLVTSWHVDVDAKPDNQVPGLSRRGSLPLYDPVSQAPASGDAQIFVPYSLIDTVMFELLQAGLLKRLLVPAASTGGLPSGFLANVEPTESPQLGRDPANTERLLLQFAARIVDAPVSTSSGPVPASVAAGAPQPARSATQSAAQAAADAGLASALAPTVSATALIKIHLQLTGNDNSGVQLAIQSLAMENLQGSLQAQGQRTDLGPLRAQIQSAFNNAVRGRTGRVTLIGRSVGLMPPFRAVFGQPTHGSVYIRLPLTVAGG